MRDPLVTVPARLTAENGSKGALMGEFKESVQFPCAECFGDDECENCNGSGRITMEITISWATIKEIYAAAISHFESAGGDS